MYFPDLELAKEHVAKKTPGEQKLEDEELIKTEKWFKPRLYTFPEIKESSAVFYEDELEHEGLFVLCVLSKDSENKAYVWKGDECEEEDSEVD